MNNCLKTLSKSVEKTMSFSQGTFYPLFSTQVILGFQQAIRFVLGVSEPRYALKTIYPHIHKDNNIFKYVYNN